MNSTQMAVVHAEVPATRVQVSMADAAVNGAPEPGIDDLASNSPCAGSYEVFNVDASHATARAADRAVALDVASAADPRAEALQASSETTLIPACAMQGACTPGSEAICLQCSASLPEDASGTATPAVVKPADISSDVPVTSLSPVQLPSAYSMVVDPSLVVVRNVDDDQEYGTHDVQATPAHYSASTLPQLQQLQHLQLQQQQHLQQLQQQQQAELLRQQQKQHVDLAMLQAYQQQLMAAQLMTGDFASASVYGGRLPPMLGPTVTGCLPLSPFNPLAAGSAAAGLPATGWLPAHQVPVQPMPELSAHLPKYIASSVQGEQQQQQQPAQLAWQALATQPPAAAVLGPVTGVRPTVGVGMSAPAQAVSGHNTLASMGVEKVKALIQVGGTFGKNSGTGTVEYLGGETRLVTFPSSLPAAGAGAHAALVSHLSSGGWPLDENFTFKYELPGSKPPTFVDLLNDADVANMWDAYNEHYATAAAADPGSEVTGIGQKLRICVEQPLAGGRPAAIATGTPASLPVVIAGAATATVGLQLGDHAAAWPLGPSRPASPSCHKQEAPRQLQQQASATSVSGISSTQQQQQQDDQAQAAGTAAAMGSLVSSTPRVALSDLEARMEVLKPDDLQVVRFLGAGGYGEVYLCRWHNCEVAVKCLSPSLLQSACALESDVEEAPGTGLGQEAVAELMKEALLLSSLRHPNVVCLYGIVLPQHVDLVKTAADRLNHGNDEELHVDAVAVSAQAMRQASFMMPGKVRPPALVTEFMAGGSVRAALSRHADFLASPAVRVSIAFDAARGMEYLHNKRIVHFDLKAANLLLGWREGKLISKVSDMGLSKQRMKTYVTGLSSLRGTLPWTAPEIITSPRAVTDKVDVFSFGITMWELWTGREPFEGLNYHALLHQVTTCPGMRPALPGSADWEGDVPPEPAPGWARVMQSCWAELPQHRPTFKLLVPQLKAMLNTFSGDTMGKPVLEQQ